MQEERSLVSARHEGGVRVVLGYPNRYWVAMSNLGFQTVYKLFAGEPRLNVERAFIPEANEDGGKAELSSEIRTFESNHSLSDAEILALSVSFETDYPYVLAMLEAAGVKLGRCLETERHSETSHQTNSDYQRPLIIGGGAALTLNPEPLANLFDVIVIGEGEEVISEILATYLTARDERVGFEETLRRLAQLEGVYVPRFYRAEYQADGSIQRFHALSGVPERVERRYLKDIDKFPSYTVIQTPNTEFRDMFMTETGRGCEVGCKFCVAGYMYRPTRKRSEEVVRETVQIGLERGKSVGFVGAAVSSHPAIAKLARTVAESGGRAALSSIMSQRVTRELAMSLSESEYKTVALAPEAGSETLRFRIGKRVCNEQILEAVGTLAESGIRNFKLYFIVGLPSEEMADVEAIGRLVEQAKDVALERARKQAEFKTAPFIYLSVNPFIPKAWTPFQRHEFLPFAEIKRRIAVVKKAISRVPNVEMKFESPRESYFQALVSRGDRRVGDLLILMHQKGEDWRTLVKRGSERILPEVPPPDFYVHRRFSSEEILPWEIVDLRVRRSLLEREYERTFTEDVSPMIERARTEFAERVIC